MIPHGYIGYDEDVGTADLTFNDRTLRFGEKSWLLPYPIHDAKIIGDKVVVIYDYIEGPPNEQFHNAVAFHLDGSPAWTAELPGRNRADVYLEFMSTEPLILWNYACLRCEIDLSTGRLLHTTFTK